MTEIKIAGIIIIVLNIIISYKGFNSRSFFEKYKFEINKILINKDYLRLLSSAFLHANWNHLIFNMLSLYFFSIILEQHVGIFFFLIIYFSSLIGGKLLVILIHKNHENYSSVGASGAVCGVIFASIALFPGLDIGFFFIPISIPSWIYGILFVVYSIYGIKSKKDNIGHEAHLGGALIGLIVAIVLVPSAFVSNYLVIIVITIPTIIFIYLITANPHVLLIDNYFFKRQQKFYDIDHQYNEEKVNKQKELDQLLEKISKKGIHSLTKKEKKRLEELSE